MHDQLCNNSLDTITISRETIWTVRNWSRSCFHLVCFFLLEEQQVSWTGPRAEGVNNVTQSGRKGEAIRQSIILIFFSFFCLIRHNRMKVSWEMNFYSKHPVMFIMIDISTEKEEIFLVRIIPLYRLYYRKKVQGGEHGNYLHTEPTGLQCTLSSQIPISRLSWLWLQTPTARQLPEITAASPWTLKERRFHLWLKKKGGGDVRNIAVWPIRTRFMPYTRVIHTLDQLLMRRQTSYPAVCEHEMQKNTGWLAKMSNFQRSSSSHERCLCLRGWQVMGTSW